MLQHEKPPERNNNMLMKCWKSQLSVHQVKETKSSSQQANNSQQPTNQPINQSVSHTYVLYMESSLSELEDPASWSSLSYD